MAQALSLTDATLKALSNPHSICPDCGQDCTEVLVALRAALGLSPMCSLCESVDVVITNYNGQPYCYHCAVELFE